MTAKEKAKELVELYFKTCHKSSDLELSWKVCKQCANIAVDEIIQIRKGYFYCTNPINDEKYWQDVKIEIEKL